MSLLDAIKTCDDSNDFSSNDLMNLPFIQLIADNKFDILSRSLDELIESVVTYSYLMIDSVDVIKEIVWRLGGDKWLFAEYFTLQRNGNYTLNYGLHSVLVCEFKQVYKGTIYNGSELSFSPEELSVRFNGLPDDCNEIAESGNLRLLVWARESGCPWNELTCTNAAWNGHLLVLKWLHEAGYPLNESICWNAAENGQLEVLQWARQVGCLDETSHGLACRYAAKGGQLEVLKWLYEIECVEYESMWQYAAEKGHLEVLQWAHRAGHISEAHNEPICQHAAKGGHLVILQWAYRVGRLDEAMYGSICRCAAKNGHTKILRWIYDIGWTYDDISHACYDWELLDLQLYVSGYKTKQTF
jgi:hypothetical protein